MTITTRRVTGPIVLPDGTVPSFGRVAINLSGWDRESGEAIVVGPMVYSLDEYGVFDETLWCTDTGENGRVYMGVVTWHDGTSRQSQGFRFDVVSGTGQLEFAPLWVGGDVPDSTQADALAQAQAAATSALASAAQAAAFAPYDSRAAAEAANIPAPVQRIAVLSDLGTLFYIKDPSGTALTTADGATWSPDGEAYPDHWAENTTPGTTDMTAAIQAAVNYSNDVNLRPADYLINGTITISDTNYSSGAAPARIRGAGSALTRIIQSDLTKAAIFVRPESSATEYKFWADIGGFQIRYATGSTSGAGGIGLHLREVNNGLISDLVIDGPDTGIKGERVVQSRFENVYFRTSLRAAGNHANAFFDFDTNTARGSGSSFGNTVVDCESQHTLQTVAVTNMFWLRAVDGLEINGGHYNNAVRHISIEPTGADGRLTVRDVSSDNVYWDCDLDGVVVSHSKFISVAAITSGSVAVFGIRVIGGKVRSQPGQGANIFALSGGASDYSGLSWLGEVSFIGVQFTGFGSGSGINLGLNAAYDETTLIHRITVADCVFRDAGFPSYHAAVNSNAIVVAGTEVTISGNTFTGNWTDAGANVITVGGDADKILIANNTFETNRTDDNISVSGAATNWRAHGNIDGLGRYIAELREVGSNSNGSYKIWADGTAEARKTVDFSSVAITSAWGSVFNSGSQALGAWPITFSVAPEVVVGGRGVTGNAWVMQSADPTASNAPSVQFIRGTSATIDCKATVIAHGTAP